MNLITPLLITARTVLDTVLPQTCPACGVWIDAAANGACAACRTAIEGMRGRPYCPRCGRTVPRVSIHADHCAKCRRERFWNVAAIARVCTYPPPLRRMLAQLKYHGRPASARCLGRLLAAEIAEQPWCRELDLLVPVPMHWLRRMQRRDDHAWQLAAVVADELGLPVVRAVKRKKHMPSQVGLKSRAARFENVKGSFAARRDRIRAVRGRTVCIIDNLLLSGATVHEVSKELRRAGALRIYAAVVGRPAEGNDDASSPELADKSSSTDQGSPMSETRTASDRVAGATLVRR